MVFTGIKRIQHCCPVGTEKSQWEGPPFQWETRLCRVSNWNDGLEGWDFPVSLNTNDQFFFSDPILIYLAWYCISPLATYMYVQYFTAEVTSDVNKQLR